MAKNQMLELPVPLLQGQQQNFLHHEIPEDALMNDQEIQEMLNEEGNV